MARHGQIIVYEHVTPPPRHRGSDPSCFFTDRFNLAEGWYALRAHVMPPPMPPAGARLTIDIRDLDSAASVGRRSWAVDGRFADDADHLMLAFALAAPARLEIRVTVSGGAEGFFLRAVKVKRADRGDTQDWTSTHGQWDWPLDRIANVIVGISGACPASCIHCPTNKDWLPVPRGQVMSDAIFDRLVQGLVDCGLPVTHTVSFGLFGEPLLDRHLAERIRRLRAAVPAPRYVINTTGAVLGPRQEAALAEVDMVAIHLESLIPETYDRIMAPLKLARVKPQIERIVAIMGERASLSFPVHRDNVAETPAIEAWWRGLGGGEIWHQTFSNRLTLSREVLDLHLAPVTGACTQDIAYDLPIDWDGALVTCCSDFAKRSNLGSLATATLPELIRDERRRLFLQMLKNRDWQRATVCRTCLFDDPAATREAVAAARAARG